MLFHTIMGDTPLDMSARVFPESCSQGEKVYPLKGVAPSSAWGARLNKMGEGRGVSQLNTAIHFSII